MHLLTGSLLCKRCRKAAKEEKDTQRNVQNPSTEPYVGLQDTKTTWGEDRGGQKPQVRGTRVMRSISAVQDALGQQQS